MGFTPAELEAVRGMSVPDLLGDDVHLLFVGINPGLWTAAAQAHFAKRGNRFYPALYLAGLSKRQIDASEGMARADATDLCERGVGITNLVNKATARADELSTTELEEGAVGTRCQSSFAATSGRRHAGPDCLPSRLWTTAGRDGLASRWPGRCRPLPRRQSQRPQRPPVHHEPGSRLCRVS